VDAVYVNWGKPDAKAIRRANPAALREYPFPAGSMGPKINAACRFAERAGKSASIGALKDLKAILRGEAGTTVSNASAGVEWA
jgi:carbamate kinase